MSRLYARLFGKFRVHRDQDLLAGLDAGKIQELFGYLLLNRNRPQPRETLAGLLWSDSSTPHSKKCLRQALWHLQTALGTNHASDYDHVLLIEPDWIQINMQADLWLDVAVFELAFARVKGVLGENIGAQSAQALQEAVDLYHGDLLEGWYQDWCLYERARLQNMYLAMLDKLMAYYTSHHKYEVALAYGTQILSYDRARECTHRRLMSLYHLAGDRAAALRQYDRCIAALEAELGVGPAKSTVALYTQIREDQLDEIPSVTTQDGTVPPAGAPLSNILGQLKQLLNILNTLEYHIYEEIQTLERALKDRDKSIRP